jgi:two-component system, NarL family, response regulator NreC
MSIRILIADDHGIVRAGLRALLQEEADLQVVGEAADGKQAIQLCLLHKPDILLLDLSMPDQYGIEVIKQLKHQTSTRILVLTLYEDESLVQGVIKAGASGYIIKRAIESELINAIHAVHDDHLYIHPAVTRAFFKDFSAESEPGSITRPEELTPREIETLRLIAKGYTNRQIANELSLSVRTVETHRSNLIGKLGIRTRVDLIVFAEKHALLNPAYSVSSG